MWTVAGACFAGLLLLAAIFGARSEFEKLAQNLVFERSRDYRFFSSDTLGFSVRYPVGWQVEIDPDDEHSVTIQNPKNYSENITLASTETKYENLIRRSIKISEEREITIDGIEGTWLLSGGAKDPATSNVVLVKTSGKLYGFSGQARDFEKIVKTVRFSK